MDKITPDSPLFQKLHRECEAKRRAAEHSQRDAILDVIGRQHADKTTAELIVLAIEELNPDDSDEAFEADLLARWSANETYVRVTTPDIRRLIDSAPDDEHIARFRLAVSSKRHTGPYIAMQVRHVGYILAKIAAGQRGAKADDVADVAAEAGITAERPADVAD